MLYLCGYRDAERQRLSDFTCTALQLANFWQDIAVDLGKDRVYLPLDLLARMLTPWMSCLLAAKTTAFGPSCATPSRLPKIFSDKGFL